MEKKTPSAWHLAWRIISLEHKVFTQRHQLVCAQRGHEADHRTPVVRNLGISPRTGVDVVVTCQIPGRAHIIDGPFQTRVPYGVYLNDISLEKALEILGTARQESAEREKESLNWWVFDRVLAVGRESHPFDHGTLGRTPARPDPVREQQRRNRLADFWKPRRNEAE